jgi:hypothetical protein
MMYHPPYLQSSLRDEFNLTVQSSYEWLPFRSNTGHPICSIIYLDVKYSDKEIENRIEPNTSCHEKYQFFRNKLIDPESNLSSE